MKRWGVFILTLAMLFAVAGAEEVFMEESFLDAGVQGEEFFSEESFFGDAFEAEAPEEGAEAEAEDRSVYLFESETLPDADLKTDWQKWYIKVTPDAVKPGSKKITLNFSLFTDQACTVPATPAGKIGKGAYAGVKFYIYDVDPMTGIPMEVPKKATTAMKTNITVKNPGDYTFYVRLENVSGGSELYGHASEKITVPVTATLKDYAVSKLKINLGGYDYYTDTDYITGMPTVVALYNNVYFYLYTKKLADAYIVTAQTQGGAVFTGIYETSDNEKLTTFKNGYSRLYLSWVNWIDMPNPTITSKGKKLTITATPASIVVDDITGKVDYPTIGKAKKATAKLALPKNSISEKTPPVIDFVEQIDANTIKVGWYDLAAYYNFITPTGYTLTYGKEKVDVTLDQITPSEYGKADYIYTVTNVKMVNKPTKMKITVQAKAEGKAKPKKSKAVTLDFLPQSGFYVYDVELTEEEKWDDIKGEYYTVARVDWKGLYDQVSTYEVYLTDSKHTTDVAKKKVSADKTKPESFDKENGTYFVEFREDEYDKLTDGTRLGAVVKALAADGTTVMGRAMDDYWTNDNFRRTVTIEQKMESAEYTGYAFYANDLFKAVDPEGESYSGAVTIKKIMYNDGVNPETEVTEVREIGKYKITAEINKNGYKKVAETDFSFEVKKRTLVITLMEENIVLYDPYGYGTFIDTGDLLLTNGEDEDLADEGTIFSTANIKVKDSNGAVVAWNQIKETGNYTVEVTVTANPATTDGLTATSDPTKGTLTVALPLTVSEPKLYIYAEAEQHGWVGDDYNYGIYGGPYYSVEDVNEYSIGYYGCSADVTFTVTTADGKEIKLGDITRQAGVYTVIINAKCEGWIDADPMTVTVTIEESQLDTLTYVSVPDPFGSLYVVGLSTQYLDYDGTPKLPEFKVQDSMHREITSGYSVRIIDSDGNHVDSAIEIGRYELQVFADEPGFDNHSKNIVFYITKPWTLEQKQTSIVETGSTIDPEFIAKAGKDEIAVKDYTKTTYVDWNIVYGSIKKDGKYVYSIYEPGKYTFQVNATVYTKNESSGYYEIDYTYAPIKNQECTLTVVDKFTLTTKKEISLVANGYDLSGNITADDFVATANGKEIPKYDSSTAPDGWQYYGIYDAYLIKDGEETWVSSITKAGTYKITVYAQWDSVYKYFEFNITVTDTWTVMMHPTVSIASADLPITKDDLIDKLTFTAKKEKDGKTIPRYDPMDIPTLWFDINKSYCYLYDEDLNSLTSISSAGTYNLEISSYCGGSDWTSELYSKYDDLFTLTVTVTP